MKKQIAVIDGNSLLHRAFHAIQSPMKAPDGTPTNAIFGFTSMFLRLVKDLKPWGIVACFDKGKPKVRMEMLPQYKAQRPPMDENLHVQFPLIKDLMRSLEIPVIECEGWEGDDLLGTLAKVGSEAGYEMLLVTGDRDMYQLSSENVKIITTKKGMSEVSVMTPEAVADLYGGITPELVPDFYGLKGDSSDNIPGVPGVGPKKAQQLIEQYGSLDGVLEHAGEIPGKMGEAIRENKENALLSRKVATILTNAPIDFNLSDTAFPTFKASNVSAYCDRLGFTALKGRLLALAGNEDADKNSEPIEVAPILSELKLPEVIEGDTAKEVLYKSIEAGEWLGVSFEESASAGSLFDSGGSLYVCALDKMLHFDGSESKDMLVNLFKHAKVASIDLKYLIHVVYPVCSSEEALLNILDVDASRTFDLSVAAYLHDSSIGKYDARYLAVKYLGVSTPDDTDEFKLDAYVSASCVKALEKALNDTNSYECFSKIEMPLVPVLAQIERCGMKVDSAVLAAQSSSLEKDLDALQLKIFAEAGEEFNIDSPKQLSHILFDVLSLPSDKLKKNKSGYVSTNAKILSDLSFSYEIVRDVLSYREKGKIKKTYLDSLPKDIALDGRIHTSLNQTITATGRLSSSDPNLQNIPVKSEEGKRVRSAFGVDAGCKFLVCDYSQIELRLLAHLSKDPNLIEAFCSGNDFHAQTAAKIFGVSAQDVTPIQRRSAKAVNFGIVYGQQAYGLAQSLHITNGAAADMIRSYFEAYPGVKKYLDLLVDEAKQTGYVSTMFGRRRYVPDVNAGNRMVAEAAKRTALNHPMQGSAADIIKLAMIEVEHALNKGSYKAKLIMQIHDELDLEVPTGEIERVTELVKDIMQDVVRLDVPLLVDVNSADRWDEAK